jgi:surface polysaccharide O-acyltransferase-like enzyme
VGSHANLFILLGGAHVLLAVAGFNFARFHLTDAPRTKRLRHMTASVTRIAVPSAIWIGLMATFTAGLGWTNALLLNGLLGSPTWVEPAWHYWFIEALVYTLVGLTLLMALPVMDKAERRWPFWLPMTLACLGLLTRYEFIGLTRGDVIHRAHIVFWLFALGWAALRATASWQRVLVSAVAVMTVPGFFDDAQREAFVVASMLALVWLRSVRVPSWAVRSIGVLASASLYIYLIHWQVYPHLEYQLPWLATVLSLLAGVVMWRCVERVTAYVARHRPKAAGGTGPIS